LGVALIEIRWHGRGGQGAVTAAEILASAAAMEGRWAQAFPSFGAERRGAPVQAFTRIDDKPIFNRSFIYEPDVVVVLDEGLLNAEGANVMSGLKPYGKMIVNTSQGPREVAERFGFKGDVAVVDATSVALEVLGAPIVNTAILGAVVKALGIVSVRSVTQVLKKKFSPVLAEKNIKAFSIAYERTIMRRS
jgi:pyruvate ferredoxin oxidoreductase gamma subunit/2-oxoisovalerate ferredoxin oxidoreductase gamma subunit